MKALLRIIIISCPLWLNDFYLRLLPEDSGELRLTLDILFYIVLQSVVVYLSYQAGWFNIVDIKLDAKDPGKQLLSGLALFLIALAIAAGLATLRLLANQYWGLGIAESGHAPLPEWSPVAIFFYVFYLAITAGLYEELIYRGIVIGQLRAITQNKFLLALGSASVFSIIHWSLGISILGLAFALGFFWAVLFLRTGKLLPLMIAHFLFDFVTFYGWHRPLFRAMGIT